MINQCILVIPFSMKPNCKVRVVWAAEDLQEEVREIVLTTELFWGVAPWTGPPNHEFIWEIGFVSIPKNLDLITFHHAILVLQTQKMPKDGKPLGPKKW